MGSVVKLQGLLSKVQRYDRHMKIIIKSFSNTEFALLINYNINTSVETIICEHSKSPILYKLTINLLNNDRFLNAYCVHYIVLGTMEINSKIYAKVVLSTGSWT